jgi:polyhydroxyalkanoate synthase
VSLVENALSAGFEVFLIDWGEPDERDARNGVATYVDDVLAPAIERTASNAGSGGVSTIGYCMGSLFCLLAAASHQQLPIKAMVGLTTPIDLSRMGFLLNLFTEMGLEPADVVDESGLVSAETVSRGFKLVRPTGVILQAAELWVHLANDEYVLGYRAIDHWVKDQIPMTSALLEDWIELARSDTSRGTFRVRSRTFELAHVKTPLLSVVAEEDTLVPRAASAPLLDLVGSAQKQEIVLPGGHIGVVVGRRASRVHTELLAWLRDQDEHVRP